MEQRGWGRWLRGCEHWLLWQRDPVRFPAQASRTAVRILVSFLKKKKHRNTLSKVFIVISDAGSWGRFQLSAADDYILPHALARG